VANNVPLAPEEEQELRELMRRCDALSNAHAVIWDDENWTNLETKAQTLFDLSEMMTEAEEAFRSYKRELGIA
jgi:hypothetical protein